MPYKEKNIEKKYFTISEVGAELQLSPSVIRFWEQTFNAPIPKKNKQGARKYTRKDIATLQHIYHLVREKKYTLKGAKKELNSPSCAVMASPKELIEMLKGVKAFLMKIQEIV